MRPGSDLLTVDDLRRAVDVDELRDLLAQISRRGERVSRSWANYVARDPTFPAPILEHPKLRLWLRREVDTWIGMRRANPDIR